MLAKRERIFRGRCTENSGLDATKAGPPEFIRQAPEGWGKDVRLQWHVLVSLVG